MGKAFQYHDVIIPTFTGFPSMMRVVLISCSEENFSYVSPFKFRIKTPHVCSRCINGKTLGRTRRTTEPRMREYISLVHKCRCCGTDVHHFICRRRYIIQLFNIPFLPEWKLSVVDVLALKLARQCLWLQIFIDTHIHTHTHTYIYIYTPEFHFTTVIC